MDQGQMLLIVVLVGALLYMFLKNHKGRVCSLFGGNTVDTFVVPFDYREDKDCITNNKACKLNKEFQDKIINHYTPEEGDKAPLQKQIKYVLMLEFKSAGDGPPEQWEATRLQPRAKEPGTTRGLDSWMCGRCDNDKVMLWHTGNGKLGDVKIEVGGKYAAFDAGGLTNVKMVGKFPNIKPELGWTEVEGVPPVTIRGQPSNAENIEQKKRFTELLKTMYDKMATNWGDVHIDTNTWNDSESTMQALLTASNINSIEDDADKMFDSLLQLLNESTGEDGQNPSVIVTLRKRDMDDYRVLIPHSKIYHDLNEKLNFNCTPVHNGVGKNQKNDQTNECRGGETSGTGWLGEEGELYYNIGAIKDEGCTVPYGDNCNADNMFVNYNINPRNRVWDYGLVDLEQSNTPNNAAARMSPEPAPNT